VCVCVREGGEKAELYIFPGVPPRHPWSVNVVFAADFTHFDPIRQLLTLSNGVLAQRSTAHSKFPFSLYVEASDDEHTPLPVHLQL